MTKLSISLMAGAVVAAALAGTAPAFAGVQDRNTETRGGLLAGAQTPSVSKTGSFVHRGKAIVWVPSKTPEQNQPQEEAVVKPNKVMGQEANSALPRVRAVTAGGAFVQNGKITTWVPSERLAEHLKSLTPSGIALNPAGRVVLLGGAEVNRNLLASLSEEYVMDSRTLTQPPAVTRGGAFIHDGKTTKWVPSTNSGPTLGQ